jgi:MFS family permease
VPIRYLTAAVLARLADAGAQVALVLLALDRTSSAAYGGILIGAFMLPHVLAAPGVGAFADRSHRRRLVHAIGPLVFACGLATAAIGVGRLPDDVVFGAAVLGGCAAPLISGGLTGLLRDLVPAPRRQRAYALDAATYSLAGICGPAFAGVAASALSPSVATLVLAGCGVAAGAMIGTLPLHAKPLVRGSMGASMRSGVVLLLRHPTLRAMTLATSFGTLGTGALPLIVALLAVQYGVPAAAGALLSAEAVGSLVGSLAYARWPLWSDRPQLVIVATLAATAVPLAVAARSDYGLPDVAFFAAVGVLTAPAATGIFSVREGAAPAELNTQIFALGAGMKITFAAFGAAVAGQLGGFMDPRDLLLLVAGCQGLGALVGVVLLGRGSPP